ncbi:MAG: hypothetical protein HDT23_02600 [Ruminococcus sp.]|nr:hypothetical protein [Ruminococcus sp.]
MKYRNLILCLFLFTVSCGTQVGKWSVNIPVRSDDINAVTFNNGDFSFASVITDDINSAQGGLSIENVLGNNMLKFTDDMTVDIDGKVQKICINTAEMIGTEKLPEVRSIEFDVYADAVSDDYINQDGINTKASGTICIGGGTVISNGKWYDFAQTQGGEYNLAMSGAVHCEFKFLLAESGYCWDKSMNDANFLIMRWGSENQSNLYIDNIVFYDEDKNSIPLVNHNE